MRNKDKKLTLDEIKAIQLEMLIDFDRFCRQNNITYFLSYGTLLGAIRHKGYIPWDDDIDVMVPRTEIDRVRTLYKPGRYKIADATNELNYEYPYPRMIDTTTYRGGAKKAKLHGAFIDIYVIDGFPETDSEIAEYRKKLYRYQKPRRFLLKVRHRLFEKLPLTSFPLIKYLAKKQEEVFKSIDYDKATKVHVFDFHKPPLDKGYFDRAVEVEFDGHKFLAPYRWDEFLKCCYGDYMQLPPEDQRHPYHTGDNIYQKIDK